MRLDLILFYILIIYKRSLEIVKELLKTSENELQFPCQLTYNLHMQISYHFSPCNIDARTIGTIIAIAIFIPGLWYSNC